MKTKWIRQEQESEGTYMFNGRIFVTSGIQSLLSNDEIQWIMNDVKLQVTDHNGIDYLVVYEHEDTGQKLFFIDQLNRQMIESGQYSPEHNYATLLLSSEY